MSTSKKFTIAGWIVGALPVLGLIASAGMKLTQSPEIIQTFVDKGGYPASALLPIAITEIVCTIIYLVPRTAVLGAMLLTGYLGGAVSHHVRLGEPFFAPILFGILLWLGLYLRDANLRALVPVRAPRQ